MLLIDVVRVSEAVTRTSARLGKIGHLAELLGRVGPDEAEIAISYLSGELPQRQVGVGWRTLEDIPQPKLAATATLTAVDELLSRIKAVSGQGSQAARKALVAELFAGLTSQEQQFMRRLLHGELRQGALDGVMIEAVAKASGAPSADVRRALTLRGWLPAVGAAALGGGVEALRAFRLEVGRAVSPMLAGSAPNVAAALEKAGPPAALEWKLDGVRVQAHRCGPSTVTVFTRTLDDITAQVPELVEAVLAMPSDDLVLDGEVIALRPDGRPHPFQVTASRVSSKTGVERLRERTPLSVFFFDALRVDGADLLDLPYSQRQEALAGAVPPGLLTPRLVTGDVAEAEKFFTDVVRAGHEGLVVKSLASPYAAGRRGAGWIKVKPRHTLDLVVLAAEWGHGRREGKLSNLHLGARDPEGGFVMLGKTFKGLTDELLAWQTERFLELAEGPTDEWTVTLRPELVVEIAFDGVQRSPRYPGGMALRFARVLRYRPDKRVEDADTVDTVRSLML
ncbi:ATP-dependent DNA ligase [Nonomuraea fuscirosea]|uniref:ATP-dependent DNA ligase n=1 Tax=Nonomuraea fuscirosea TaxID=1291556 RepID=UPI002DD8DFC8|nr:ATP-dependent DNA ligase [Nonomuraea fuscirosea]WSA54211.1 ATP-dependent DNA ligase [Nonomuraea fuscirosea]